MHCKGISSHTQSARVVAYIKVLTDYARGVPWQKCILGISWQTTFVTSRIMLKILVIKHKSIQQDLIVQDTKWQTWGQFCGRSENKQNLRGNLDQVWSICLIGVAPPQLRHEQSGGGGGEKKQKKKKKKKKKIEKPPQKKKI